MPRKRAGAVTVLAVDDEEVDRTRVSNALSVEGNRVLEAESYSDAIATFDMHRDAISILVADLSLPDGNGCALAIAMRNQREDLRVLFVSGHVGAEVCKYYGLEVGAEYFLRKPFDGAELVERVRNVLLSSEPFRACMCPKHSRHQASRAEQSFQCGH